MAAEPPVENPAVVSASLESNDVSFFPLRHLRKFIQFDSVSVKRHWSLTCHFHLNHGLVDEAL